MAPKLQLSHGKSDMKTLLEIWPYIVGGLAIVAGWFTAKRSGAKAEQAKQDKERLQAVKKAKEVQDDVDTMDNNAARQRAGRWVRDHKKR